MAPALKEPTGIVSVMLANNETGVIQDVAAVAELRAHGAGVDAYRRRAGAGQDPRRFCCPERACDELSAHKIYGPKGVGALVLDKRIELKPLISGGGTSRALRSGTENVPAIVGFGAACELAAASRRTCAALAGLREQLERGLHEKGAVIFGAGAPRMPNTSYFAFPGIEGETLVVELDNSGFAVASRRSVLEHEHRTVRDVAGDGCRARSSRAARCV